MSERISAFSLDASRDYLADPVVNWRNASINPSKGYQHRYHADNTNLMRDHPARVIPTRWNDQWREDAAPPDNRTRTK
jgi:hypothetical protein